MSETKTVRAHCNQCGGARNCFVRAEHEKVTSHGDVVFENKLFRVLECCGCDSSFVQHIYSLSEDEDLEVDVTTGNHHWVPKVRTTYYPPALVRKLPPWFRDLQAADALLAEVLSEVYTALESSSLIVATTGARLLLDRAMDLLLGEDAGSFAEKLKAMTERGVIGREDRELLDVVTDAGHAASHRGFRPEREHLETILDTMENLLHRKFVLTGAAASVKRATPPRPARPQRSRGSTNSSGPE